MNHEKYANPPQRDIDRMTKSRILHDAKLLQGGAEIVDSALRPTSAQIELMKQEHTTSRTLGRLTLLNPLDEVAEKSIGDIVKEDTNREQLLQKVRDIFEPYGTVFDERIPSPSDDDKNWRGKLKESVELEGWTTSRSLDHTTIAYMFEGTYKPGLNVNFPERITMSIKGIGEESKRKPAIEETLEYDHTLLKSISFKLRDRDQKVVSDDELIRHNTKSLVHFLDSTRVNHGGNFKITLSGEQITLQGGSDGYIPEFLYTYNPTKKLFYRDAEGSGCYPDTISEDQFVGIVKDLLNILPVKSLPY